MSSNLVVPWKQYNCGGKWWRMTGMLFQIKAFTNYLIIMMHEECFGMVKAGWSPSLFCYVCCLLCFMSVISKHLNTLRPVIKNCFWWSYKSRNLLLRYFVIHPSHLGMLPFGIVSRSSNPFLNNTDPLFVTDAPSCTFLRHLLLKY